MKGTEKEMVRTIQAVARGEALFGPAVASRLMAYPAAPGRRHAPLA